eukprot:7752670-Alexandrium_andersonii.AAC.1
MPPTQRNRKESDGWDIVLLQRQSMSNLSGPDVTRQNPAEELRANQEHNTYPNMDLNWCGCIGVVLGLSQVILNLCFAICWQQSGVAASLR